MRPAALAAALLALAGCSPGYASTLLPTATGGAEPPEYRVEVPAGYDVRSVDYDAALVGIATGPDGQNTDVRGRGVVTVYAVHRATGREVAFVYDDVQGRAAPSAVIRIARPSGR